MPSPGARKKQEFKLLPVEGRLRKDLQSQERRRKENAIRVLEN
jgi:hypothetical protein